MLDDNNNPRPGLMVKTILLAGLVLLVVLYFGEMLTLLKFLYVIVYPLLLGAAIAYAINILVAGYEKIYFARSKNPLLHRTRRGVCILLAILTIILILVFFLRIILPQLYATLSLLAASFPAAYNQGMEWARQHSDQLPGLQEQLAKLNMDGEAVLKRSAGVLQDWAFGTFSFIYSIFNGLVTLTIALVFGVYALFSKEELKKNFDNFFKAYLKNDRRQKLYAGLRITNETFTNYIVGQCKEAVILGLLCTIGMLLLKFPYAITIGPVIGLTALIPMVGAYLGAAVGFFLIVVVNPLQALLFIVFIIVLQQLEGNLIYPKVVGESIGLPGIWVIAAITVGGGLMGIVGMLLGVPVAAAVYKLSGKSIAARLRSQ